MSIESVGNIKYLHSGIYDLFMPYKIICNKIITEMVHINDLKFLKFRDVLYDIFIYDLDIGECIWYILTSLIEDKYIKSAKVSSILIKTSNFLKYYNNNYRPIYHLESFLFYLTSIIHEY